MAFARQMQSPSEQIPASWTASHAEPSGEHELGRPPSRPPPPVVLAVAPLAQGPIPHPTVPAVARVPVVPRVPEVPIVPLTVPLAVPPVGLLAVDVGPPTVPTVPKVPPPNSPKPQAVHPTLQLPAPAIWAVLTTTPFRMHWHWVPWQVT
jgi:hypothetical protein